MTSEKSIKNIVTNDGKFGKLIQTSTCIRISKFKINIESYSTVY